MPRALSSTSNARPTRQEGVKLALALLDMLPRTGKVSTAELHDKLQALGYERSRRSIERQMEALCEEFPIECDRSSKPYGYKWQSDSPGLSIPGLTLNESLILRLAEEHLRNLLPPSLLKSMAGFFEQARVNLGPTHEVTARQHRRWLRKVRVISPSQPLLPPPLLPGVLDTIATALYRETWLDIDYRNASGKQNRYRVMPLGLAQQGSRLILVVRFQDQDNERSLALSRILKAEDSGLPFTPPPGFELDHYEEAGRFGFSQGEDITVRFRLPRAVGQFLTESRLSLDQRHTELPDGRLEFSATVKHTEQLLWWLRGFGPELELLAPRALKQSL